MSKLNIIIYIKNICKEVKKFDSYFISIQKFLLRNSIITALHIIYINIRLADKQYMNF